MIRRLIRRLFEHGAGNQMGSHRVKAALLRSYPHPGSRPLPRGAITRIAHEAGVSQPWASRVARRLGYTTEHYPERKP